MMPKTPRTAEETYEPALRKAQLTFRQLQPHQTAARAGVVYEATDTSSGLFRILFLGTTYLAHWPGGTVERSADHKDADIATHILLLHYLLGADGNPVEGEWISFRNLPGGLGYDAAFRRRASLRLAGAFGTSRRAFEKAAQALGGEQLAFGDASFLFRALPRVWLAVVLNLADEEFPADANVLFDLAASHYLPTEDLAVLGGMLAGRLINAAQDK
jgi:hypothetical protein